VIREAGGDRSAVTGGTRVLSDWHQGAGHGRARAQSFLDRMIALVEGAERQKTPNEIALDHPAVRPDADLPDRGRDPAALRALRRGAVPVPSSPRCW
jgi:hypothetical protein